MSSEPLPVSVVGTKTDTNITQYFWNLGVYLKWPRPGSACLQNAPSEEPRMLGEVLNFTEC